MDWLTNLNARLSRWAMYVAVAGLLSIVGVVVGSVIIAPFADRAAAQGFADNDPYAQAGLFGKVVVNEWRQVLPRA